MMRRRDFVRHSLLAGAPLAALQHKLFGAVSGYSENPARRYAYDTVSLGPDGLKPSRLAMGTGTSGFRGASNQTRKLGVEGLADLYRFGFDNGLNFWDTADGYGSHPHVKRARCKHIPREQVVIMTKSSVHDSQGACARTSTDSAASSRTDYIDLLLLHAVREEDWPVQRAGCDGCD